MLFNEPKLLKSNAVLKSICPELRFSALQRAEIAEIYHSSSRRRRHRRFSALQRAEIAEMMMPARAVPLCWSFSALQRAEIAEIDTVHPLPGRRERFQCSSTSRNC